MRNLTKALAVVSVLVPAGAYPLGIGDIKLHSALNQNLDAEISLVLSAGEKISDIKVSLAPSEKFIEAGIPWNSFLSKIKFQMLPGANGSAVIKLSSREALKEPFLDLMLEVSWPKGNLYREFTVLLDPSSDYEQPTIPVSSSVDGYQAGQNTVTERQSVVRPRSMPEAGAYAGNGHTTTGRNDTLWSVAKRVNRDSDISSEQMMIAIYKENPRAFYKENINALLAGRKLKIPERDSILKLSRKQALTEFNRQTKEWKNRLIPEAVEAVANTEADTDNQLTLHAPAEAAVSDNVDITSADKQAAEKKVDNEASAIASEADKQKQALKHEDEEPEPAKEGSAVGVIPADEAIQTKIADLEKQLAMMQKILALKDQQLAMLQNQPQAKPVVPGETAPSSSVDEVPIKRMPQPEAKPQQPTVKSPLPAKVGSSESKIADSSYDSYYYLGVAGIGSGLLTVAGWFWLRNRRLDRETGLESIRSFSGLTKSRSPEDSFSDSTIRDGYAYDKKAVIDNLFLADFVPGEFEAFEMDHDEIDPISEVDVYLAYGRYQQAEDLMRHAIQDQPDRDECKLKLLEIFYSNNNQKAFESYANELADAGKKEDSIFWPKVVEMGSEICPNSALFTSESNKLDLRKDRAAIETNAAQIAGSSDGKLQEIVDDGIDFSTGSFEDLFQSQSVQETSQPQNDFLDFDISSFEDEVIDANKPDNRSIDFDFSSIDFNADKVDSDIKKGSVESHVDIDLSKRKSSYSHDNLINFSFENDFDFDITDTESCEPDAAQPSVTDLTKMDEMETKLDLAIAYIDMSDKDAAKDIAMEVLEKGTMEQKMIAQSLLDDLKQ